MRLSNDKLLTRNEVAAFLGVPKTTLEVWATNKRYNLPYIKVGRSVRYWESDVMAFLDDRTVNPNSLVGG